MSTIKLLIFFLIALIATHKCLQLQLLKQCGKPFEIQYMFENKNRQALIFFPSLFCDEALFSQTFKSTRPQTREETTTTTTTEIDSHALNFPILLAIHCLGCDHSYEMKKWQPFSEKYSFITVAPLGIHKSWNADECCEPANVQQINDTGFMYCLISDLMVQIPTVFPFVKIVDAHVGDDDDGGERGDEDGCTGKGTQNPNLFVSGWSNGGFMADKLAWESVTTSATTTTANANRFHPIVAIAPLSGFIGNRAKYTQAHTQAKATMDKNHNDNDVDVKKSVAVYFHHSNADTMVNANGCCASSRCCCSIDKHAGEHCTSVKQEYKNWLDWNECDPELTFDSLAQELVEVYTDDHHGNGDGDAHHRNNLISSLDIVAHCAHATIKEHHCLSPTSLCLYEGLTHHWGHAEVRVPVTLSGDFFLRTLCAKQNGFWNDIQDRCVCSESESESESESDSNSGLYFGPHCITRRPATHHGNNEGNAEPEPATTAVATDTDTSTETGIDAESIVAAEARSESIDINGNDNNIVIVDVDGNQVNTPTVASINVFGADLNTSQAVIIVASLLFGLFATYVVCRNGTRKYKYSAVNSDDADEEEEHEEHLLRECS